jgi:O-antigen ligase
LRSAHEAVLTTETPPATALPLRPRLVSAAAFCWGLSAFLPVGVMYLNLLVMLLVMGLQPDRLQRLVRLRQAPVTAALTLLLLWSLLVAAVGPWFPDSATRLFHLVRVALVMSLGLMLSGAEARLAIRAFLASAMLAVLIVAANGLWGLPDWAIWSSLLQSRNNFSSGNMIVLASASGIFWWIAAQSHLGTASRWSAAAAGLATATTVALHAQSRNAQLLMAVLLLVVVVCRFRSLRATLGGGVAVLTLAVAAWWASPAVHDRFAELVSDVRGVQTHADTITSIGLRWRMAQEAVAGIGENPVLGTGLGSWLPRWHIAWAGFADHLPPDTPAHLADTNNPHNDFLLTGMETGIPAMLILIWFLLAFIVQGWRRHSLAGGVSVLLGVAVTLTAAVNAPLRDAALGTALLWLLAASMAWHRSPVHA